jgi:hypothetical protein
VCDIKCDRPTFTLYVLDFASTINGWKIDGAAFGDNPGKLKATLGPEHLSIQVFNPYHGGPLPQNFFIIYSNRNHQHGEPVPIDPQEGNIPPVFPE